MTMYFECRLRQERIKEDGKNKKVSEGVLVDAVTPMEAEKRLADNTPSHIVACGDYNITAIHQTNISEVVRDPGDSDYWYKVKIGFANIDEKTHAKKISYSYFLVQADTFQQAWESLQKFMKGTVIDYETASVTRTSIVAVIN